MEQLFDKAVATGPNRDVLSSGSAVTPETTAESRRDSEPFLNQSLFGNAAVATSPPQSVSTSDFSAQQFSFGNAAVAQSAQAAETNLRQTQIAAAPIIVTTTLTSAEPASAEKKADAAAVSPGLKETEPAALPARLETTDGAKTAPTSTAAAPPTRGVAAPASVGAAIAGEATTAPATGAPAAKATEKASAGQKGAKTEAAPKSEAEKAAPQTASPHDDPGFKAVVTRVGHTAARQKTHASAGVKSAETQAAVEPPSNDISSRAATNQVGEMAKQKPKPFDRQAFMDALMSKIDSAKPQTLEDADEFKDQGKLNDVKTAVTGEVTHGKDQAQSAIAEKTKEAPSTSGIEPKAVTGLPDADAGPAPGDVKARDAAPKPKTAAEVSLDSGSKELDQQMEEGGITEGQLAKSNEPEFQNALDAKKDAQTDSVKAPQAYRRQEQGMLTKAQAEAHGIAQTDLKGMHAGRGKSFGNVHGVQSSKKAEEEKKRAEVATHIEGIYDKTKKKVEDRLAQLDHDVNDTFDRGAALAQGFFENYVETEMDAYKDRRYSSFGGGLKWAKDKLFGMPDEVNKFYEKGRERYVNRMKDLLWKIAGMVEQGLTEAHEAIESGKEEIRDYVDNLDGSVKQFAKQTAKEVQGKFDQLEETINEKQKELVDSLAKKYSENLKKIDDRIEEMKAANRGLVDKALDAVVGVIKTILKLKDMLLDVLSRVADAVGLIIQDPIGFLGNLVDGIGLGIRNFKDRIGEHLKQGLIEWLFGELAAGGIQLPDTFDLKGILSLVLQILGLTYANIRARAVNILGAKVVSALETAAEIFKILITEGPAGLWNYIVEKIGNFKDMILEQIKSFIIERVIVAGITWLIGLLNPASAFIKACKAIYDIIMFFVEHGSQILALINAIIDSITAIAKGAIDVAANFVEQALAKAIPVVIGFLAALLGLGGLSDKIKSIINSIREPINAAIDWVIHKAVDMVKAVGGLLFGKKEEKETEKSDDPEHDLKVEAGLAAIDEEDAKHLNKEGKITLEEAEAVATKVKGDHPIFKTLKPVESETTWDYEYSASKTQTKKGAAKQAEPGDSDKNPIDFEWVKPAVANYPPVQLAPADEVAKARNASGTDLSPAAVAKLPKAFVAHPTQSTSLEDITIGVTNPGSQTAPGFVFQAQAKQTGNSVKNAVNRRLEKFGYNREDNPNPPTDGDHVLEKQLGGPDAENNVWPLNSSINRSSGAKMRGQIDEINSKHKFKTIVGKWLKLKF